VLDQQANSRQRGSIWRFLQRGLHRLFVHGEFQDGMDREQFCQFCTCGSSLACAKTITFALGAKRCRVTRVTSRFDNHDNNPTDGSNWELLCLYCHDNEHQKQLEAAGGKSMPTEQGNVATHNPFANLKAMLGRKE
jgi:hypothetical protein